MKKTLTLLLTLVLCTLLFVGCSSKEEKTTDTNTTEDASTEAPVKKKVIGVSLMTLQYEFFQDIKSGIEAEAGDDYEIVFNDPALDLQSQIDAIENFCAQGVDAIILNAIDGNGVISALDTAEAAGIPVITVDMKPAGGKFDTYIGSDNFLGGQLAAKWAIQELFAGNETPNIVFLTNPLSAAAVDRIDGFKDIIKTQIPGAVVVAEQGADTREAFMSTMEDILTANDKIDLVFAYSAQGGLGAYDAIQAAGRDGEISVVGFDASAEEQEVITAKGGYKGSIMQFPDMLGKTCVESVTKRLSGETLDQNISVEVGVYTADKIFYASDLQ